MNGITLAPLFNDRRISIAHTPAMADELESAQWFRHRGFGIEACSICKGGSSRHGNEDGVLIRESEDLLFVVADETSRKIGLASREALNTCLAAMRSANGAPSTLLAEAHTRLRRHLGQVGPHSRVGVSAIACTTSDGGRFVWSSVGDCSILHWQPARWWRRRHLTRINLLHRDLNGQLAQALGTEALPCADTGSERMRSGDILLIGSDGVFHENLDLSWLARCIEDSQKRQDSTLQDLTLKILCEARLEQPSPDDVSLVLIHKL